MLRGGRMMGEDENFWIIFWVVLACIVLAVISMTPDLRDFVNDLLKPG